MLPKSLATAPTLINRAKIVMYTVPNLVTSPSAVSQTLKDLVKGLTPLRLFYIC